MENVYKELSGEDLNVYMLSGKFEHPGGFNILSIENFTSKLTEYSRKINSNIIDKSLSFDDYIWETYNKPWLESALQRGDDIIIWSDPIKNRNGYYMRELDFIEKNAEYYGYNYKLGIRNGVFEK